MQIRAENYPKYYYKFIIIGICAIGYGAYCLLDGFVRYPAQRERGFIEFKQENPRSFKEPSRQSLDLKTFEEIEDVDLHDRWEHYSHDRGIPSGLMVTTQFVQAAICAAAGLFLLSMPLRARGRWIQLDDSGISSSWGDGFRFNEVESVNKRKWRSKGICKVTYVASARRSVFVIDDFKFDRWATDAILHELEQRIDQGRIVNGPPEPEPEPEGKVAEILRAAKETPTTSAASG
jgi:hypothetical protein